MSDGFSRDEKADCGGSDRRPRGRVHNCRQSAAEVCGTAAQSCARGSTVHAVFVYKQLESGGVSAGVG